MSITSLRRAEFQLHLLEPSALQTSSRSTRDDESGGDGELADRASAEATASMEAMRDTEPEPEPISNRSPSPPSDEAAPPSENEGKRLAHELLADVPPAELEALAADTARALEQIEHRLLALFPPPSPLPRHQVLPSSSAASSSSVCRLQAAQLALLPAPLVDWRVQQQVDVELALEIESVMHEVRANNMEQMDKFAADLQVRVFFI